MEQSDWGMHTNFISIFLYLLLPVAKQHNVPKDEMIKRLFVFSDMQFDNAARGDDDGATPAAAFSADWETNHDRLERAYAEAGYDVPELVYWNFAGYRTMETEDKDKKGVEMMSGFSPGMLEVFMGEEEAVEIDKPVAGGAAEVESVIAKKTDKKPKMTPVEYIHRALGKASYAGLKVVD